MQRSSFVVTPLIADVRQPHYVDFVMDYHRAIRRYYQAYRDRDRESLRSLLTPNFHFVSSFGEYGDRDAMLDEIWPAVGQAWATNLRIFGQGPEFVVLYAHENAPGVERPGMTMAEYVRFEGERIAEIEVFLGRPVIRRVAAPEGEGDT
jgi:ketosteroid isomerase-like protein